VNDEWPQKGRGQGHVTYFLNFAIQPSITFQRMKVDSSFFLCWIGHGKYYIRDDEWTQRGRSQGYVSYFWSNGTDTCVPQKYFLWTITSEMIYCTQCLKNKVFVLHTANGQRRNNIPGSWSECTIWHTAQSNQRFFVPRPRLLLQKNFINIHPQLSE